MYFYADITRNFFQSLETEFGKMIISRLVSYISSSKHGLTEMEVLDIMSSDPQVRSMYNNNNPAK